MAGTLPGKSSFYFFFSNISIPPPLRSLPTPFCIFYFYITYKTDRRIAFLARYRRGGHLLPLPKGHQTTWAAISLYAVTKRKTGIAVRGTFLCTNADQLD